MVLTTVWGQWGCESVQLSLGWGPRHECCSAARARMDTGRDRGLDYREGKAKRRTTRYQLRSHWRCCAGANCGGSPHPTIPPVAAYLIIFSTPLGHQESHQFSQFSVIWCAGQERSGHPTHSNKQFPPGAGAEGNTTGAVITLTDKASFLVFNFIIWLFQLSFYFKLI